MWMENIRDWNISRQLWWGHRIPVWYCDACDETIVEPDRHHHVSPRAAAPSDRTRTCSTPGSPAGWPFSTLGWPEETDGPPGVLSRPRARHRARDPLLLGRADDHGRLRVQGRGAVPHGVPARHGARHPASQDVQVARQRHRPARGDRTLRRRRAALHDGERHGSRHRRDPRPGRPRRVVRTGPQLRQQALEHRPLPARASRGRRTAARSTFRTPTFARRSMDPRSGRPPR